MKVIKDTVTPELERIKAELKKLKRLRIHIGVQGDEDSELLMIAGVHEYGAVITAKKARHLAIPLKKSVRDKSPRDVDGLFFMECDGDLYGVKEKGKDKLEFLFWLPHSVTIPERSFIRGSIDNHEEDLLTASRKAVYGIYKGEMTANEAAEYIGQIGVSLTKAYFKELKPPKGSIALAMEPSKTTPLIRSGRLWNSITCKVEEAP